MQRSDTRMGALLSLSKPAISTLLEISEIVLLIFGALLVVGLIGESAKSERWKNHLRLFEMFVIIGVAGELLADGGIFLFSRRLQTIADLEITRLTREAGDAKTSADSAASASSRARASAEEANIAAGAAREKADSAARLADEAARNVGLTEFLVSARFVADPNTLTEQLKPFKGRTVVIRSYAGDAEGWNLCTALLSIAHSAEMNPIDECGRGQLTVPLVIHIEVSGPDIQETLLIGKMISRTGRLGVESGIKGLTLTIFVGMKSPFVIGQTQPARATKNRAKKHTTKP